MWEVVPYDRDQGTGELRRRSLQTSDRRRQEPEFLVAIPSGAPLDCEIRMLERSLPSSAAELGIILLHFHLLAEDALGGLLLGHIGNQDLYASLTHKAAFYYVVRDAKYVDLVGCVFDEGYVRFRKAELQDPLSPNEFLAEYRKGFCRGKRGASALQRLHMCVSQAIAREADCGLTLSAGQRARVLEYLNPPVAYRQTNSSLRVRHPAVGSRKVQVVGREGSGESPERRQDGVVQLIALDEGYRNSVTRNRGFSFRGPNTSILRIKKQYYSNPLLKGVKNQPNASDPGFYAWASRKLKAK